MTRYKFQELFREALEESARWADRNLGKPVPRAFVAEVHGAGYAGTRMGIDQAAELLYLDENRFYKIIDIAIIAVAETNSVAFVRASDHAPVHFEETWNPQGLGPFKQIESSTIKDARIKPLE